MSHDPKTTLESLLLDDRDERIKRVAALAHFGAKGTMDIATALTRIDQEIERDPIKARELTKSALAQALACHAILHGDFRALINYAGRNGLVQKESECVLVS